MPVIAVVGAGSGLGAAVAHKFGREGFTVALIARNPAKLEALEQQLAANGITARGYVADVRDRTALDTALESAAADLGPIEVLQFSPVPSASS
ncbi:SDR family NAD(P)-dependent oxidoreductase [Hoyosella altamirensis]|uniref:NADP-dependent 3-hydroxy acid dehydrogenase YdfG n=1 Tax=Hoyosella altamirensis TaxID=616997 RepID=A0A839RPP3_9ACTN|nr:SDR family NAD(P)-dependent oxidoreductase [Hoyosella altamirensis]MBB3038074.1 NADP-dependent 3-hydroxy acid dehydrogenase YdfG [Hoyosella altamirensis]